MNSTPGPASARDTAASHDHAARVAARYYAVRGCELFIGGLPVTELAEKFGTPLFVYDQGVLRQKVEEVRSLLPARFQLYYSIKANPNAAILDFFLREGCGLEVASGGELFQAIHAGCPPHRVIFAGPGKTRDELAGALAADIREIHVESVDEARCLDSLARTRNKIATIALRINPVGGAGGAMRMGGRAAPFGIDEEDMSSALDEVLSLPHLRLIGVHLFMATQVLDAEMMTAQYQRALAIAREVAARIPEPFKTLDFGGGLGTPYFAHETELDLNVLARGLACIAAQMAADPLLSAAEAIIEPGRFLVNEAGIYLARVTRIKSSRGRTFAVLDGGMHHHLAASGNLGQTIKRNFPVAVVNKLGRPPEQTVDVVGPLCTPLDMLARQAPLPRVEPGDLFGVFLSGAYARTSSPLAFLSHNTPAEILVRDGQPVLIRRRGTPEDLLRDQIVSSPAPSDPVRP